MVNEDLETIFSELHRYADSKFKFNTDSTVPDIEFNDLEPFDYTSIISIIKTQTRMRPNLGEASLNKSLNHFRAMDREYDMRLMDRASYWSDSIREEEVNLGKIDYNKKSALLDIGGN